jgi:hypothetical protein
VWLLGEVHFNRPTESSFHRQSRRFVHVCKKSTIGRLVPPLRCITAAATYIDENPDKRYSPGEAWLVVILCWLVVVTCVPVDV